MNFNCVKFNIFFSLFRNEDDVISKHENEEEAEDEGVASEKAEKEKKEPDPPKPAEPKEADQDRPSSSGEYLILLFSSSSATRLLREINAEKLKLCSPKYNF